MNAPRDSAFLSTVWSALDGASGALAAVSFDGPSEGLPSVYPVAEAAAALVGAATLAVAELHAARARARLGGPLRRVRIERGHVVAAFRSERYMRGLGWSLPDPWDAVAGDYEARDGWIRLHTNYAWHRDAALSVLGAPVDRAAVTAAVRAWEADALERAVVKSGGAAAVMRTPDEWRAHPQGQAVAAEPLVHLESAGAAPSSLARGSAAAQPLAGVRVLDLTRVIAGPVCTRFLAAFGADVIRVDPPGFDEVGALLGDTTGGKRRVALDLRAPGDRAALERLVAGAHVVVSGYRGGALAHLGFAAPALRVLNPGLVLASLDAYGWTGPWKERRGFDSLVQMSCGMAARGRAAAGVARPTPLPAQALDHGTGYLLAAAVCRALTRQLERGTTCDVRASLARTAAWLMGLGDDGDLSRPDFTANDAAPWIETVQTAWGALERVRCPGRIEGVASGWTVAPGPLGVDAPAW